MVTRLLLVITYPLMVLGLYMAFLYAPRESVMGEVQRIMYLHVPVAWTCFIAFFICFVYSIAYLATRKKWYDTVASCAAELGFLFCSLVLITGPIWAKPAWNTWWTWDPRLTTTLVLWMMYASYLILRNSMPSGDRQYRFCAVVGIVGFLDVPIVYMSIRWWRTIHPLLITTDEIRMDDRMYQTLYLCFFAVLSLFLLLLALRVGQRWMEETVERAEQDARIAS